MTQSTTQTDKSRSVLPHSSNLLERLEAYRTKLFDEIKLELKINGHCKRYDGRVELHWPCYLEDEYSIHLTCYVLGPSSSYNYCGKTWNECFNKAEADLDSWIKERLNVDSL